MGFYRVLQNHIQGFTELYTGFFTEFLHPTHDIYSLSSYDSWYCKFNTTIIFWL